MRTMCAAVLFAAGLTMPAVASDTELNLGSAEVIATYTPDDQPTAAAPAPDPAKVEEKKEESGWRPWIKSWTGGIEIGLNGSEGNSENFNVHAGANAQRKTDLYDTRLSLTYLRASADGDVTKNRFEANAQNDWIFAKGSPWRYFIRGTYENDDFQDWQQRLTLSNGLGYAFIENERTTFIGRAGVGVRRDWGSSDNRWHPEGLLGMDLSHKLTERQLLTATVELFPDLLDLSDFRARVKVGWEILVDPETKMSLKLGVEDRYDSDPGPDKKKNDIDYFALLVWSF
jgi:putative salt-induced outer membrane protein YdiY